MGPRQKLIIPIVAMDHLGFCFDFSSIVPSPHPRQKAVAAIARTGQMRCVALFILLLVIQVSGLPAIVFQVTVHR
jgi:hypothetical protein